MLLEQLANGGHLLGRHSAVELVRRNRRHLESFRIA